MLRCCGALTLGMATNVKECYDQLADHYHLIFENWDASIARQASAIGPILERECGPAGITRVLDCACGIGTQVLGLLKLGFTVFGCDLSPQAISRAKVEAAQRGFEPNFSVADMLDLRSLEQSDFDAVLCMDNALPHLKSSDGSGEGPTHSSEGSQYDQRTSGVPRN